MSEELLRYYNQELSYLRQQGAAFAKAHPKIAGRLNLGAGQVEDPFVARLLESFAFLTARIQHKHDEGTKHISNHLLNILYPHYHLPIPSISIAEFKPHEQLASGHVLARHTELQISSPDGNTCYFRTCYPTKLWPIHIENMCLQKQTQIKPLRHSNKIKSCLTLHLKTNKTDLTFYQLKPDKIRCFIKAEPRFSYLFYELLFNNLDHLAITQTNDRGKRIELAKGNIKTVGFTDDESLLPYPRHSFSGYALLTEFFAYPEKFLFFDITGLDKLLNEDHGQDLQIHCFFNHADSELESIINKDFLTLNCTPIINLFECFGEPIRLNHQQTDYHVVPDFHLPKEAIEIYSINDITVSSSQSANNYHCSPYFGRKFERLNQENHIYWYEQRKQAWELGDYHLDGCESFLTFSDLKQNINSNDTVMLMPKLLCSNRDLARHLSFTGDNQPFSFWHHKDELVASIHCITPMSTATYRQKSAINHVDLISHLALNQLCFDDDISTLNVLKEVLSLYNYDNERDYPMINEGLIHAKTKGVTKRHLSRLRQGFYQGVELTLEVDESYFPENNIFLFASIMEQFLTKACSINSFTQLILTSKQRGVIHTWKPRLGYKETI